MRSEKSTCWSVVEKSLTPRHCQRRDLSTVEAAFRRNRAAWQFLVLCTFRSIRERVRDGVASPCLHLQSSCMRARRPRYFKNQARKSPQHELCSRCYRYFLLAPPCAQDIRVPSSHSKCVCALTPEVRAFCARTLFPQTTKEPARTLSGGQATAPCRRA